MAGCLNLFFCKDQKLIDYVQETVGMAAIGKVYQEHMIIAYGGGAMVRVPSGIPFSECLAIMQESFLLRH